MSYQPNRGHGPYPPQDQGHYQYGADYPRSGHEYPGNRRGDDNAETVANVVRVVTGITTAIFVLHIAFVVLGANQGNGFVSTVYTLAKTLVLGLGDVFTPDDALLGVFLNYGLAALVYLVIGQLIIKALRR